MMTMTKKDVDEEKNKFGITNKQLCSADDNKKKKITVGNG